MDVHEHSHIPILVWVSSPVRLEMEFVKGFMIMYYTSSGLSTYVQKRISGRSKKEAVIKARAAGR